MHPLRKKCIRQLQPPRKGEPFRVSIPLRWSCITIAPPDHSPQCIRLKTGHETRAWVGVGAFEPDHNSGLMRMELLACNPSTAFTTSVTIGTNYRDNCHDSSCQLAQYIVTADTN